MTLNSNQLQNPPKIITGTVAQNSGSVNWRVMVGGTILGAYMRVATDNSCPYLIFVR